MKIRCISFALILTLTVCLFCGCAVRKPFSDPPVTEGISVFEACGEEKFAQDFESDTPVSVTFTYLGEGGKEEATSNDAEVVRKMFNALSKIIVGEETQRTSCDDDRFVTFTMSDKTEVKFSFVSSYLRVSGKNYLTSGISGVSAIGRGMLEEATE